MRSDWFKSSQLSSRIRAKRGAYKQTATSFQYQITSNWICKRDLQSYQKDEFALMDVCNFVLKQKTKCHKLGNP